MNILIIATFIMNPIKNSDGIMYFLLFGLYYILMLQ